MRERTPKRDTKRLSSPKLVSVKRWCQGFGLFYSTIKTFTSVWLSTRMWDCRVLRGGAGLTAILAVEIKEQTTGCLVYLNWLVSFLLPTAGRNQWMWVKEAISWQWKVYTCWTLTPSWLQEVCTPRGKIKEQWLIIKLKVCGYAYKFILFGFTKMLRIVIFDFVHIKPQVLILTWILVWLYTSIFAYI